MELKMWGVELGSRDFNGTYPSRYRGENLTWSQANHLAIVCQVLIDQGKVAYATRLRDRAERMAR